MAQHGTSMLVIIAHLRQHIPQLKVPEADLLLKLLQVNGTVLDYLIDESKHPDFAASGAVFKTIGSVKNYIGRMLIGIYCKETTGLFIPSTSRSP